MAEIVDPFDPYNIEPDPVATELPPSVVALPESSETPEPTPTTSAETPVDTPEEPSEIPPEVLIALEHLDEIADAAEAISSRPTFEDLFGEGFIAASELKTTNERIAENTGEERDNTVPFSLQPWELRIGLCKFFVPPINIQVQQVFKAGSMLGGAIRQPNTPKFNTGHTETQITMTVYFPSFEHVFGIEDAMFTIDFDNDDDEKIDKFVSSLRGLIAEFKYSPILPIRNAYLNQTFGITGVILKDLAISTVPDYPYAMAATITLAKFNHKVFMPMVDDFDQAIHYGRFRQYLGRAASRLSQSSRPIATFSSLSTLLPGEESMEVAPSIIPVSEAIDTENELFPPISGTQTYFRSQYYSANNFEFFFPFHTPAAINLPNLDSLKPDPEQTYYDKTAWEDFLAMLGINVIPAAARWEKVSSSSETGYIHDNNEYALLTAYFHRLGLAFDNMGPEDLIDYTDERIKEDGISVEAQPEFRERLEEIWYYTLYRFIAEDPYFAQKAIQNQKDRDFLTINEWEIPMWKLDLDLDKVKIQSVAVSIGNVFAKLQLQLQDEPTYQHIGGQDARIEIAMTIVGESELIKFRNMFNIISGLARLEQGHGVLGFLGVRNVITELLGVRYCIPLSFAVDTIPGFPHVYDVRLALTDFDIFQQKRETLSYAQQAELAQAFGKMNPFLRLKQLHGFVNCYPDFPLEVRDGENNIVGHLSPDYYFRHFDVIDADVVNPGGSENADPNISSAAEVVTSIGNIGGEPQLIKTAADGLLSLHNGEEVVADRLAFNEHMAANNLNHPIVPEMTPASQWQEPLFGGGGDPSINYQSALIDMKYRNKDGRMIRAFPTYMLWLIDEVAGPFGGMKLFDNFWGMQSVIDFSIVSSEDILGDTLVLRISNLSGRMSTRFQDYLEEKDPGTKLINLMTSFLERRLTGQTSNYVARVDTIDLRPGLRLHMRAGYSSDPNDLDIIFNGTITEVQNGEIMTVIAQSDAIELSAMVNTSDKKATSGSIDGNWSGLFMSEPRDLMITLLTQGSSAVREMIAHASRGAIFSENRFGIRHFGTILYEPLDFGEEENLARQRDHLTGTIQTNRERNGGTPDETIPGFFSPSVWGVLDNMWANLALKRDFEVFKRNIYPGNGVGIAQFLGGDVDDAGLNFAVQGTGPAEEGELMARDSINLAVDDLVGSEEEYVARLTAGDVDRTEGATSKGLPIALQGLLVGASTLVAGPVGLAISGLWHMIANRKQYGNIFHYLGFTREDDDDGPFDEIAFRASTYMSTVWDMFKLCAAMLPDYIVAVRPFEGRSTIFYGKPHWLYTSGVIPVSTGARVEDAPESAKPGETELYFQSRLEAAFAAQDHVDTFEEFFEGISAFNENVQGSPDLTMTTDGIPAVGIQNPESIQQMPTAIGDVELPYTSGKVVIEMHLPTSPDLQTDIENQSTQLPDLPEKWRHPFYMDRADPGDNIRGGTANTQSPSEGDTVLVGESASDPGRAGASGYLDPVVEKYYMNMRWTGADGTLNTWRETWEGKRVLVYCQETNVGVICEPAEWGPAAGRSAATGVQAGVSPDAFWLLSGKNANRTDWPDCIFRVFPDQTVGLGPVSFGTDGINADGDATGVPAGAVIADSLELITDVIASGADLSNYEKRDGESDEDYVLRVGAHIVGVSVNTTGTTGETTEDGAYNESRNPGMIAAQVYYPRTLEEANEIWDEFRTFFHRDTETIEAFMGNPVLDVLPPEDIFTIFEDIYLDTIEHFREFMWTNGYARGWLARVANKRVGAVDFTDNLDTLDPADTGNGFFDFVLDVIALPVTIPATVIQFGDDLISPAINFLDAAFDNDDDISLTEELAREWDFSTVYTLYSVFITQGDHAAIDYMKANIGFGRDEGGLVSRIVEEVGAKIDTAADAAGKAIKAVGVALSGLINFFRLMMHSLTDGTAMSGNMQRQTNVLNRLLNDSIYFQAGRQRNEDGTLGPVTNPLLYYCDNPFTREFGEPVVEIREPFQRVHTIGSFQHIINNGIIETTNGVATVVTATSNEKFPVTVHFDKAAPAEKQVERTVETGLVIDKPGILKILFNPIDTARWFRGYGLNSIGNSSGISEELSAKRVALSHLKESLKDIYQGEILIIGDASIRPYDLVYLYDVVAKMAGPVEVEQVIHHFSPETGFVTSITPNACVSINDPARFSYIAQSRARNSIQQYRNQMRHSLEVYARNDGGRGENVIDTQVGGTQVYTIDELIARTEDQINMSLQYTGGNAGLVKSIGSWWAVGGLASVATGGIGGLAVLAGWAAWGWIRDNLLDQHGCYIQYLTKNGQPMDAGLSWNQGVAVGHQSTVSLVVGGLRLADLNVETASGNDTIKMSDVVKSLQWNEYGPNDAARRVDLFVDATIAEVRNQAREALVITGFNLEAYWCRVVRVIDADTFDVETLGELRLGIYDETPSRQLGRVRLNGINTPEDPSKTYRTDNVADVAPGPVHSQVILHANTPGGRATQYAVDNILGKRVAIRVDPLRRVDVTESERTLGYIFHNAPEEMDDIQAKEFLLRQAAGEPAVPWNSYLEDGRPRTFNWELIINGHADSYTGDLGADMTNEGITR